MSFEAKKSVLYPMSLLFLLSIAFTFFCEFYDVTFIQELKIDVLNGIDIQHPEMFKSK